MNATDFATCGRQFIDNELTFQPDGIDSLPTFVAPAESAESAAAIDSGRTNTLGLVELLLKNRPGLHQALRNPAVHAAMLPRLLAIALTGFVLFGIAMSLVLTVSNRWPALTPIATWINSPSTGLLEFEAISSSWGKLGPWVNGRAFVLTGAYAFGLVAASGVALPSLYFYCLLAGVRMSMLEVVVHAVKAKAIAAVALIGILPIYVAAAMGAVIFNVGEYWLQLTMYLGLVLPFIAGLWGTASLYQGFAQLCDTMPADRAARRECFLRRLVLSWSACYSAVMPVMIYSLWEVLSRR
ncbi:MAG TPA: hypothetical protein VHU84_03190 [Lacipirellulaceae bacterium]|nr:hypothetical protein [Lacipirellulaceae bacterium]